MSFDLDPESLACRWVPMSTKFMTDLSFGDVEPQDPDSSDSAHLSPTDPDSSRKTSRTDNISVPQFNAPKKVFFTSESEDIQPI